MKTYQPMQFLVAAALTLFSANAVNAGIEAHGGGAFICANPIENELIDLYEAKIPTIVTDNGIQINRTNDDVEVQIDLAISKVSKAKQFHQNLLKAYQAVKQARKIPVQQGIIAYPNDMLSMVAKPGCTPIGLILFNDAKNLILMDQTNIARLPKTDQAALWVHEIVYKLFRDQYKDITSIRARKIVAHLFSNNTADETVLALRALLGEIIDHPSKINEGDTQIGNTFIKGSPGGTKVYLSSEGQVDLVKTLQQNQAWYTGSYDINGINELVAIPILEEKIDLCQSYSRAHSIRSGSYIQSSLSCYNTFDIEANVKGVTISGKSMQTTMYYSPEQQESILELAWWNKKEPTVVWRLFVTFNKANRIIRTDYTENYKSWLDPWEMRDRISKPAKLTSNQRVLTAINKAFQQSLTIQKQGFLFAKPEVDTIR